MPSLNEAVAPPDALVDLLRDVPVAVICDALDLLGLPTAYVDGQVLPRVGRRIAGRAHTVGRVPIPTNATQTDIAPALTLGVQIAIDSARAGQIIVLASGGEHDNSIWGGNMGLRAALLGVAGVVTDGALRDVDECAALGLPVFAAAINARRSLNRMVSVSVGEPVVCGGVYIREDDIVIGDADGVVVVQPAQAEAVHARAIALIEAEENMRAYIRQGHPMVDAIKKFKNPK
ncbi:MAG: RraA family protein [Rhodocyclaceae bacterium]